MALNKDQKLAVSGALNRLLRREGVNFSEDFDLFSELLEDDTSAPITLYVNSTGSDSNPGTIGAPLATVQEALNRVPKNIKHPGTGNTTAFSLNKGARCVLTAASTITGTTEITMDGTNYTIADMRAASPKLLTNTYGTIIYE